MREAQRVPQFMQAREVDDRVAEQRVEPGLTGNLAAQGVGIRTDVHGGATAPIDGQRSHLAVLPRRGRNPVDADQGVLLA